MNILVETEKLAITISVDVKLASIPPITLKVEYREFIKNIFNYF